MNVEEQKIIYMLVISSMVYLLAFALFRITKDKSK